MPVTLFSQVNPMNNISIADSLRIVDLQKKNYSYRAIEAKIGIPKSTIHYNIHSITESVMALDQKKMLCDKVFLVRSVLICVMDGGMSTRRISTLIKRIWETDISHQTVQLILQEVENIAYKLKSFLMG